MFTLKLMTPQKEHKISVMDFREEFLMAKERISGGIGLEQAENYEDWLAHKYIPHYGLVDEAVFLAFDNNDYLIGISDIRLGTNDFIQTFWDTLPTDFFSSPNRLVPGIRSRRISTFHLSPMRVSVVSTGQAGSSVFAFTSIILIPPKNFFLKRRNAGKPSNSAIVSFW